MEIVGTLIGVVVLVVLVGALLMSGDIRRYLRIRDM